MAHSQQTFSSMACKDGLTFESAKTYIGSILRSFQAETCTRLIPTGVRLG
jgi:hypothetical protein